MVSQPERFVKELTLSARAIAKSRLRIGGEASAGLGYEFSG
jgi:hypothetical protein